MKKQPSLEANGVYHIYNHAVDKNNIFRCEENYSFFLKRYLHFIQPIAKTYSYCLLPNHFHIVLHIKKLNELEEHFSSIGKLPQNFKLFGNQKQKNIELLECLTSQVFSHFFNSYAQAYNKMYERKGNLFMSQFKRKKVIDRGYFKNLIIYIHRNPLNHGLCDDFEVWHYSSFHDIKQVYTDTWLYKNTVLNAFEGCENFIQSHIKPDDWNYNDFDF